MSRAPHRFASDRVAAISRALVENSLRMRSVAFLSQVKMSLMLDTLKSDDEPLNYLRQIRKSFGEEAENWVSLPVRISEEARELQQMTLTMERRREELRSFLSEQTKELRQSEARFRLLFDLIPDGVCVHRGGCWLYMNPAAVSMFGADSETELIGTAVMDRVHPDYRRAVSMRMQAEMSDAKPATLMQQKNLRMDGSEFWTDVQGVRFVEYDEVAVLVVLRDITAEKLHAEQLEHTQRLESLGILAGGIAHDFNNILTAIMGNAAMAERGLSDASPARVQLSRITESSRRASELCRQMLAYSGKGRFVVKPLNLSLLVAEMTRLMEVSIGKNVQLTYQLDESLPMVEADAAQIQQVVLNLITNANEAIGEQSGVISFSTGVMQADADYLSSSVTRKALPEGRYVWLEVSDTGCGMDAATAEKIFDPFFTTKFTGRGLGMSAVLGIVRGHHGALRVFSEPGQGATFRMLLPIAQDSSASASLSVDAIAVEHGPFGEGVVLVVDDEETIREVAVLMLEEIGFATLTAVNGQDAVDIYRQHAGEIVAVLLDMTMPKMDGSECFYALRRINPDVKVVLSSGYSEEEATTRFIGQGLGGFLHKPYTPEDLRATMTSILQ
ncbi:MAG: hybrid sensor histidine kinase/response regulator [Zetaproteobacteria bacterium CG12_big_fil_rev_8_21_14_0_65_54_13]|nr:MAG: hybrid sensor histidine kinase/response regulator [Zetaproteobacteria bacterium CG12_big_fil_rev_8_21_14_0_65_54_13]